MKNNDNATPSAANLGSKMLPQPGDKILVMKEPWLSLILSGAKTVELRGAALKGGKYFLGYKQKIYGVIETGHPYFIESDQQFRGLRPLHRVIGGRPYKNTFGLPIVSCRTIKPHVPYIHRRGAIGIVKYR